MQTNPSYLLLFICVFFIQITNAQDIKPSPVKMGTAAKKDTIFPLKKDSIRLKKERLLAKKTDTIAKDSLKPKEVIDDVIVHKAKDYTLQNAKTKKVTLYNEAEITYTDIDLKAGIIIIDYKKNVLFAKGIKDSTGYVQRPIFKQGNQESEQDSLF